MSHRAADAKLRQKWEEEEEEEEEKGCVSTEYVEKHTHTRHAHRREIWSSSLPFP
jgi:hypothetical protein